MDWFSIGWNAVIMRPMVNILLWLYGLLFHNYVLAILIFTAITRLILWPLTQQQTKSSTAANSGSCTAKPG